MKQNRVILIIMSVFFCVSSFHLTSLAADRDSVLALIKAPIAGVCLPSKFVSQAEAYLLSHKDIDYDKLTNKINAVRSMIAASVQGKEVKSLSDISKYITPEQKNQIMSSVQQIASEAKVSIALDDSVEKEVITVVDKTNGVPIFNNGVSIIKPTGRSVDELLPIVEISLFFIICLVEISCFYVYKKYSYGCLSDNLQK